jgi:hypothetical protein
LNGRASQASYPQTMFEGFVASAAPIEIENGNCPSLGRR